MTLLWISVYGVGVVIAFVLWARFLHDGEEETLTAGASAILAVFWPVLVSAALGVAIFWLCLIGIGKVLSGFYRLAIR